MNIYMFGSLFPALAARIRVKDRIRIKDGIGLTDGTVPRDRLNYSNSKENFEITSSIYLFFFLKHNQLFALNIIFTLITF